MEDIYYNTLLYDLYGDLLTDKQKDIFRKHYLEDASLNEIAYEHGCTKQAVHTIIKRTKKILTDYEDRLYLVKKHIDNKKKLEDISLKLSELPIGEEEKAYLISRLKEMFL
ncbi:MAG: DNA-binding protein [Firmicutes bacterium]|nr:DNA-binding protein [Bacillota bacterium]